MIPRDFYAKIHEAMPIACIDLVIPRDKKILLLHRRQEPAKDAWWLPGGRIWRGESFEEASWRLARTETGLALTSATHLGVDELRFKTDPFGHGKGTHALVFVMLAIPKEGEPVVDPNHQGYRWSEGTERLDPYVQRWMEKAGLGLSAETRALVRRGLKELKAGRFAKKALDLEAAQRLAERISDDA